MLLAVFGLTAGGVAPALAGGLAISPVVIEINSPRQAVAVRVSNDSDAPVMLQSDVFAWRQVDGVDRDEETDEVMVVPPIVEVPAKSSQIFRVMLRVPTPSPVERTYHLSLEDISEVQASDGPATLNFKINHLLPILVAPTGKVLTAMRWKPCAPKAPSATPPAAATACVHLLNAGNRRVKVQALTLAGDGWEQALMLETGSNLLVGGTREWHVPLAEGRRGEFRGVQVKTARGETLQVESGEF